MDSGCGYKTTVCEKWRQKAKDELNEDDKERDGAIQAFREWALQQKWLKTPTDTEFLLRFLRVRKFSQLGARTTLEHYWTARSKYKEWYHPDVSSDSPIILDIIKSGFYLFSPGEDNQGRRLIIERPGALKVADIVKKYGSVDVIFQAVMCIWDVLNMDERVQINGFVLLHDGSMSDADTAKSYNVSTMRRCFHIYQLYVHGKSLVPVYKNIDQTVLPKEYLPDDYNGECAGTISDVVDYMVNEFTKPEVVAHIRNLNCGNHGVDIKGRANCDVPAESFRKLNID